MLVLRLALLASLAAAVPVPDPKPNPAPAVFKDWAVDNSKPDRPNGQNNGSQNAAWIFNWNKLLAWLRSRPRTLLAKLERSQAGAPGQRPTLPLQ